MKIKTNIIPEHGLAVIEISGAFDPENIVFLNARKLLCERCSEATVASFDASLKDGSLFDKEIDNR